MMEEQCSLCSQKIVFHTIREGDLAFCCHGCHAVFRILSTKNQLDRFQESAVFKQAVRSGLISNPALLDQIRNKKFDNDRELEKLHLEIAEMWCPSCAEVIQLVLLQEKGVHHCVVDYATDVASISFSLRDISREQVIQLIRALGYRPEPLGAVGKAISTSLALRFAVAAFCAVNVMMFAYPIYASFFYGDPQGYNSMLAWISFAMTIPVVSYCAWPIWRRCFTSIALGLFGMETLVLLGVASALGLSLYHLSIGNHHVYFDSITVIIALVLLGKILESKAKFSAKESLLHLARAIPRRGRKRLSDGNFAFIPIKEIAPGDSLVAFSGEKIVLDGVVTEGEGICDESFLTGEAIPLHKQPKSKVLGGSILQNGSLVYCVTDRVEEMVLHRILDITQQEMGHKTVYVRAADQIVRWFVPAVLCVAFFSGAWAFWTNASDSPLLRFISVLLISCPCAIGIAAPLAEAHVMHAIARLGAIVRNRGCLRLLGQETIFIFDKTGTITEGRFTVLTGLDALTVQQKRLLKTVAARSTHPIASAIAHALSNESPIALQEVQEHSGKGLKAFYEGQLVLLGSVDFLQSHGINPLQSKCEGLATQVYFCIGQTVTCLTLGDRLREGAAEAVAAVSPAKAILLSGDQEGTVAAVAKACGFTEWQSGCTPLQKQQFIADLRSQGHIVCMLGDGINDAPALSAAHVGISVVSATEISIQVSDLLLTTDRFSVLMEIRSLAKRGRRIVKQNLFWAFFYNVIGVGLAALGLLTPLFAAFAMTTSSIFVLLNAKRS